MVHSLINNLVGICVLTSKAHEPCKKGALDLTKILETKVVKANRIAYYVQACTRPPGYLGNPGRST